MSAVEEKEKVAKQRPPVEEREVKFKPMGSSEEMVLTVNYIRNYLTTPTRSGQMPTNGDVIKFLMLCKARALNPWEGDAYLTGYDNSDGSATFSLITAVQALLKRAELCPEFDGLESGVIVLKDGEDIERRGTIVKPGETLIGGYARCLRKDRSLAFYCTVQFSTYDTGRSRWKKDPAGMITKCFDEETEVLTEAGFVKFADVTSRILEVGSNGLNPVDAVPFFQKYEGDMIELDSDDLNFCVTPNHDMVTTAGKIEAGEMYEAARVRPVFWIPRCVRAGRIEFPMTDESIRLAGYFLADGDRRSKQKTVSIAV